MDAIWGLVGFVAAVVLVDLAALYCGHDSRPPGPEPPLGTAPGDDRRPGGGLAAPARTPLPSPHRRDAPADGSVRSRPGAPGIKPARRAFAPYVPREVLAYRAFDLAAAGK